MQQLLFLLRQPSLMLLMGLTGGFWSGISQAGSNLDINLTASIVNSTCKLSLENGGEVYLPNVTRAWFYNNDGSSKYAPTDEAGGTPFNVRLEDCADNSSIKQLMFSFTPQSDFWSNQNQVFKNDATTGAAQNVGIVIFSADYKTNVLNSDGNSNVVYDVSGKSSSLYLTDYQFYARYQNTGAVVSGVVTSNVLVDVSYE
ncbi:fimbrial-like protein [Salmonella enterica subsp. enterica serovar Braenderup]